MAAAGPLRGARGFFGLAAGDEPPPPPAFTLTTDEAMGPDTVDSDAGSVLGPMLLMPPPPPPPNPMPAAATAAMYCCMW